MLRWLVRLLAAIGALTVLAAVGLGAALWIAVTREPALPDRMVLTLDLRGGLDEVPATDLLSTLGLTERATLTDTVLALQTAAQDERVAGLIARVGGEGSGYAVAQELRDAVAAFRATGKFAYAHADAFGEFGPGTSGYYLASAFEQIHLQPVGALGLTGLLIETPLLRELFDKVGVQPAGDKRGVYKTAADIFTESELTPAHRETLESLADSLARQIRDGLSQGRALDPPTIDRLIDGGPYLAREAAEAALVDRLGYWDEVVEQARAQAGVGAELVSLEAYRRMAGVRPPADAPVIALVYGVGQIQRGESDYGPAGGWIMGGDTVAGALEAAIDDPEVSAILFRIDSGGGSAVASDTIGRQVRRAKERGKPVIVSMGNFAASGGYWIAMDAAQIVAGPATLTGSIGVFAGKPVLSELWAELGVNWGRVERGANASMWSTQVDYTERGRARLEAFLDQTYAAFLDGVARGRDLPEAKVRAAAEGRVWTGAQARELGLVDELGGFLRAVELAREAAGVAVDEPVELRRFPPVRPPWERALELLGKGGGGGFELSAALQAWLALLTPHVLSAPPLMVR